MQKPSLPKGTRDFLPDDYRKRAYVTSVLTKHFEQFSFDPIATPSFENLSALTGKYGEEGDRLIFKILNSGAFTKKLKPEHLTNPNEKEWLPKLSDKALRYDLTVPFARFVVQHQNEIVLPFRRYQIQNVWRADRPQKGRYREFTQCDADIVGSDSLLCELDLVALYDVVFSELQLPVTLHLNNRKILQGIAENAGVTDRFIDFTVALDKLDKIGKDKVIDELIKKKFTAQEIEAISFVFDKESEQIELTFLKEKLANSPTGLQGIKEVEFVINQSHNLQTSQLKLDLTLARGIDYYTGCILEASVNGIQLGSVGGGGRYDELTEIFGLKGVSGVGISFGLDRICLAMEELNLFPKSTLPERVLFMNFGEKEAAFCHELLSSLRSKGVSSYLYPDAAKFKKQMQYANKVKAKWVAIVGSQELEYEKVTLKNMETGEQESLTKSAFLAKF